VAGVEAATVASNQPKYRMSWDAYFMSISATVSMRSTCDRKHVGSIIVRDRQILSTGYNGSPRGLSHCDDVGHMLVDMGGRQSCVRTIHAEKNAIVQAARNGVRIEGAKLYTTAYPCPDCGRAIINAGIIEVIYGSKYDSRAAMGISSEEMFKEAGVALKEFKEAGVALKELGLT
jgi:dCMP deaminase